MGFKIVQRGGGHWDVLGTTVRHQDVETQTAPKTADSVTLRPANRVQFKLRPVNEIHVQHGEKECLTTLAFH